MMILPVNTTDLVSKKNQKKIRIYVEGGFHNSPQTYVLVDPNILKSLGRYALTPLQMRRLDRHFCGINSCLCGGVERATWSI